MSTAPSSEPSGAADAATASPQPPVNARASSAPGAWRGTLTLLMIFAFLTFCGIACWPTLYRYDYLTSGNTSIPIRVHRLTGETETFRGRWQPEYRPPVAVHVRRRCS